METEDTIDLIALVLIVGVIGFIVYEIATSSLFKSAASGASQYISPTDPTSNGALFWQGINNFFSTGSIYGDDGSGD
jgi:NhaP-type Na+/H+ or K+/H+ antiporter